MKRKVVIEGKAMVDPNYRDIQLNLGRSQTEMELSKRGAHNRILKLKDGDKVRVTVEVIRK